MQLNLKHHTTKVQAVAKIKQFLSSADRKKLEEHITVTKEEWTGDLLEYAFTLQGQEISGTLTVTDDEYQLYAKLPLMFKMFEGRTEREIRSQADTLLK